MPSARVTQLRMNSGIRILMRDPAHETAWRLWTHPVEVLEARTTDDIVPLLHRVEQATKDGLHAIGFMNYEAGPAFDRAFVAHHQQPGYPLAWFALFERGETVEPPDSAARMPPMKWKSPLTPSRYRTCIAAIKRHIANGETYQVNFTFPLRAPGAVDAYALFAALYASQPSPYAMYIETPFFQIASVSPESFFTLRGDRIVCEPMKGTCPRGPHPLLDQLAGEALKSSGKNRAENVMIVDMVRNDLGRIAEPGSVRTESLFDVNRWPTLWQMTSTVSGKTTATMAEIFTALFPCASITGAPKLKTSEIIANIETHPRGIYTGAIGWWFPGRHAQFAVAIRTAIRVEETDTVTYGIGSGIVWDSDPDDEYRECLLKSRVLSKTAGDFRLLETMRWEPASGYLFLDEHLQRMKSSAGYFDYRFDEGAAQSSLEKKSRRFGGIPQRVRLLLSKNGRLRIACAEATAPGHFDRAETAPEMTGCLDAHRVPTTSPFLYHKTTRRKLYEQARRRFPHVDEVLLINDRDEAMEFTTGNLVIRTGANWQTPHLASGLLPGVFRDTLIRQGEIREALTTAQDVLAADAVYFINSVRGWRRVRVVVGRSVP